MGLAKIRRDAGRQVAGGQSGQAGAEGFDQMTLRPFGRDPIGLGLGGGLFGLGDVDRQL